MNVKISINYIMYSLLIFLAIFTDCIFSKWLNFFGRSLLNILLPMFFLIFIFFSKKIIMDGFIKNILRCLLYLVFISILVNSYWTFSGASLVILTENIWIKSVKETLYWINIIMYIVILKYYAMQIDIKELLKPFFLTTVFLFIINIIEWIQLPHALPFFHHLENANLYYRIRLTTTESSTTVPLIIVYGGLSIYYTFYIVKKKYLQIFSLIMMGVFLLSSGSKTLLFCSAITVIVYTLSKYKTVNKKEILIAVIGSIIGIMSILVLGTKFYNIFNESRGSTYTIRSLPSLASLITSIKYPLGLGAAVYKLEYLENLKWIYNWFSATNLGSTLSYYEVKMLLSDKTDFGIIAGFFDLLVEVGIIGILFFICSLKICYQKINGNKYWGKILLKCIYWCTVFLGCFTNPIKNYFMIWAFFIISQELVDKILNHKQNLEIGEMKK